MLKNLKALREAAGVTQKQLAEAIGLSQQSINKYENHNIEPDVETLIRIADYFDTSVDYLIGHSTLRRKYEAVKAYDLNDEEGNVISNYRSLTKNQRHCICIIMESYQK